MPAAATYVIKSATWKGSVIDGLENVEFGEEGAVVDHNTDGQSIIAATFIDNIKGVVKVTGRNTSILTGANFEIGSVGSLVVVYQKRAAGKGAVAAADKTLTCAEATLTKNSGTAPHADRGTMELEFDVASAAGTSPFAWS